MKNAFLMRGSQFHSFPRSLHNQEQLSGKEHKVKLPKTKEEDGARKTDGGL